MSKSAKDRVHPHFLLIFKKFKRQSTPIKPVRPEAASVNAHDRTRTCNLQARSRVRYHCATWTCVVFLNKKVILKDEKTGLRS